MGPVITVGRHPAQFSDTIIEELSVLIPAFIPFDEIIHDPFAGEGTRLGALCDRLGRTFSGTDLEHWVGRDERVTLGDSTDHRTYPLAPFAVVTSPTYNNGVNDNFKPKDESRRLTYRISAGHDLHPNNTGRWSGRASHKAEAEYWRITQECIQHWPGVVIVNVKDSIRSSWEGGVYPLVQLWSDLLVEFGYRLDRYNVSTPGWRFGRNGEKRSDTESILVGLRSDG